MKYILIFIMCIVLGEVSAQYTYFENVIGGMGALAESGRDLEIRGDTIVTYGVNFHPAFGPVVRKYNLEGDLLFESEINFAEPGYYYALFTNSFYQLPENKGYIYTGYVNVGSDYNLGYVVRLDNQLDTLWNKYYDFPDPNTASFTQLYTQHVRDSTLIVTGLVGYAETTQTKTIVAEIDFDGNVQWVNTVHSQQPNLTERDMFVSEVDDGYILAGTKYFVLSNKTKAMVTKVDFAGNFQWEIEAEDPIIGNTDSQPYVVSRENGETMVGFTQGYDILYDTQLNATFYKSLKLYTINEDDTAYVLYGEFLTNIELLETKVAKIMETQDGGLLILGTAASQFESIIGFGTYSWLLKLDANGDQEWVKEYSWWTPANYYLANELLDIEETSDGGYVMLGHLTNLGFIESDYRSWLLKIDACGEAEWNGCDPVGIGELEMRNNNITIWPNPTDDMLNIDLSASDEIGTVDIYASTGKLVLRKDCKGNLDHVQVMVSHLSSGMYILKVINESGESIGIEKLIIQ